MSWGEIAEFDVHDADAFQAFDVDTKSFTHAAELAIFAFDDGDCERHVAQFFYFCGERFAAKNFDTGSHSVEEFRGNGAVDGDNVFFFVFSFGAEDFIHNIAVVGEEDEARRGDVQATNVKDAFWVFNGLNDVVFCLGIRGADDADGLVVCQVDVLFCHARDQFSFDGDFFCAVDFGAEDGFGAVHGDFAGFHESVCFSTRANAGVHEVFVEANEFHMGLSVAKFYGFC